MSHRVLLLLTAAGFVLSAADPIVIEQIVAKVNGEIITRSELTRMKKGMEEEMKAQGASAADIDKALKEREKDFLREKIDTMLLVQKGRDLTINLDSEVTKYVADLQRKSKIADSEKFQAYIRENTGMSYEDYRAEIKNNMLTRRVIGQEVSSKIVIPKAELRKYYDEHKAEYQREERVFLREIFLNVDGKSEAEKLVVEKKAKDLVARARRGGDVAIAAARAEAACDSWRRVAVDFFFAISGGLRPSRVSVRPLPGAAGCPRRTASGVATPASR